MVGGLFMVILKDPAWARRHGLIATKAQLAAGTADWPTYWALLAQAVAVGGVVLFGLVAIWVFGREYSDRTATDLLALPTARSTIVGAKFVVVARVVDAARGADRPSRAWPSGPPSGCPAGRRACWWMPPAASP